MNPLIMIPARMAATRLPNKPLADIGGKSMIVRAWAQAVRSGLPVAVAAGGPAEAVLPPDWGTVLPTADLAAGEAAFARCVACHNANAGGANGTGPNLYGVVGGPVMHSAGFAYSEAMTAHKAEAPTWTYDELDQFLTAQGRHVPGTKMSFAGIRDTQTRVNLIAWLRSQGSGGYAVPAPDPARQPGAAAPAEGAAETPAPGAEEAAAQAGGAAGSAPTTGPAAQATTQATPAAPSAANSGTASPR